MAYLDEAKQTEILNQIGGAALRRHMRETILPEMATAIATDAVDDVNDPGSVALAVIRIEAVVEDGETVTIGADIFEFDTEDVENVGAGNIAVDVSGDTTVKAQGLLTVAVQPIAGDTMTIGSKVYTFVPDGTANADGEIDVGSDLTEAKLNIVNAIEGDDGWNDADPLVTPAAAFSTNDLVITAIIGGTVGNAYATTETFDNVGNIFDDTTMGTETAGVDPTAGEASDALLAAINASGTLDIVAKDIDANEVLLMMDAVGADTTALAEDMAGTNNAVDAAFANGAAPASVDAARQARVPTAQEVATGNLHIALDFVPSLVIAQVRTSATGAQIAWDGAAIITGGANPYVTLDNSGSTDWSVNETIYVIAFA